MKGFVNLFLLVAFFGIVRLIADTAGISEPMLYSSEVDEPEEGYPMMASAVEEDPQADFGLLGMDSDYDSDLDLDIPLKESYQSIPAEPEDAIDQDDYATNEDFDLSDLGDSSFDESFDSLEDSNYVSDQADQWESQEEEDPVAEERQVQPKKGLLQRFKTWLGW